MALCISRKSGEAFYVGETRIIVEHGRGGRIKVVVQPEKSVRVLRGELKPILQGERDGNGHAAA